MEKISENRKEIISKSLEGAMSYEAYRDLVTTLVKSKGSTGPNQSEAYVNYTKLGDARMRRLDKTLKINEAIATQFKENSKSFTWLVISESWCGDAAHALPYINALAKLSDTIDLKIVLRDEHHDLMNQFLTNGGMSIPKLIVLDTDTQKVLKDWGPRPKTATQMVADYKATYGNLTPEFKEELQVWYNRNKGEDIVQDLAALL